MSKVASKCLWHRVRVKPPFGTSIVSRLIKSVTSWKENQSLQKTFSYCTSAKPHTMFPELLSHCLSALISNNPHQISRWPNTFNSSAPNAKPKKIHQQQKWTVWWWCCCCCCWCAGVMSELSSKAAQNPSSVPASVSERERQTAGSRAPRATLWALVSSYPFMLLFTLHPSLAPSLSHTALFPFDHILAKTCRAIYRTVVLFYLPVSICGTQKYRGLPGCWRQRCSAAEGWVECEGGKGKERQSERDQVTKGWDKRRVA